MFAAVLLVAKAKATKLWCQVQPNKTSQAHPALPNHGPNHHYQLTTANALFLMLSKYTLYTISLFEKENSKLLFLDTCVHVMADQSTKTTLYNKPTHRPICNLNCNHNSALRSEVRTFLDRVRRRIEREEQQVKLRSLCQQVHGVDGESTLRSFNTLQPPSRISLYTI